ncbi:MAG: hypothetical protein KDG52_00875 [Rhodocyclaceae bacterium]|nr:hypothetical protein [Rhodocyclaceae bacterium]
MLRSHGGRIVLHIGFHKTGSSAIQANLAEFATLYRKQGLVVPEGLSRWTGHPELAWACCPEKFPWADREFTLDEITDYYDRQCAEAAADSTLLLTSEEYCRLNYYPGAIEAVREFFGDADVTVLAYLREPLDFLLSRYRHELTHGEAMTLERFLRYHLQSADLAWRLQPWIEVFGADRVHARLFDREAFDGGSIVNDFLGALGITPQQSAFRKGEFSGAHPWLCDAWQKLNASDIETDARESVRKALHAASNVLPAVDAQRCLLDPLDLGDLEAELDGMRSRLQVAVRRRCTSIGAQASAAS